MYGSLKEECGVFGAQQFNGSSVFPYIYWGLRAQNHRGHQSHGMITYDGDFHTYKALDLVPKIKKADFQNWLRKLPGFAAIGNIRYTTSGGTDEQSLINGTQPFLVETEKAKLAVSFNGNLVNHFKLRNQFEESAPQFCYECDVELIGRKLVMELAKKGDLASSVKSCMNEIEGAFSVIGLTRNGELFGFKDPYGIKPLCCGNSPDDTIRAVSSETVGLNISGFEYDFELEPGEFISATKDGFVREQLVPCKRRALCAFEFAYFARPDSRLGNKFVYEVREEFGRNLAKEYGEFIKDADVIISLPETGDDVALGLHEATGLRWERAVRRHRYVTERAFILLPEERYATIDRKLNILGSKISGKKVAVTEDSIVRGDTTTVVIEKLRRMGAKKVYMFITFPRIIGPCFYGIDMATYGELIGSRHRPEEIAEIIGADAVNYQSIGAFVKSTGLRKDELCLGCITGKYPTPLAQKMADEMREKFENGYKETGRIYEVSSII
ncbi:MAG: amidophosphoribosyltransferase [Candidatus Bathyarchaeota archaeon]|jgi:amidophosphoribosyltransferase|nr:amidophosphoribosyltransferase [Candidatus Bathyarchaeota archaeon]